MREKRTSPFGLALLLAASVALTACTPLPRVEEALREPTPFMTIDDVSFDDGRVSISASLDSTQPVAPGAPGVPEYFATGLWPAPDRSGSAEQFSADARGRVLIEYDFGAVESGIHVLQLDRRDGAKQYVYLNLAERQWANSDIW